MTSPTVSASEPDCFELEKEGEAVVEAVISVPVNQSSAGLAIAKLAAGGIRRLSTIAEQDPEKTDTDVVSPDSPEDDGWGGSSFSLCSDKLKNGSSRFSSCGSDLPDAGDDCAAVLLACLYCRFAELAVLLPDTCERAVIRCFPSFKYIRDQSGQEKEQQGGDCCSCNVKLDCSFCSNCQDTAELLELAMEISEVCYR